MIVFDPQKPTALFVGRYQPFHLGHQRLIEEGLRRVGQACISVRCTYGLDDGKNPMPFFEVKQRIEAAMAEHVGRYIVLQVPNITDVFYGRDVGYNVERIELDAETEAISATKFRTRVQCNCGLEHSFEEWQKCPSALIPRPLMTDFRGRATGGDDGRP